MEQKNVPKIAVVMVFVMNSLENVAVRSHMEVSTVVPSRVQTTASVMGSVWMGSVSVKKAMTRREKIVRTKSAQKHCKILVKERCAVDMELVIDSLGLASVTQVTVQLVQTNHHTWECARKNCVPMDVLGTGNATP